MIKKLILPAMALVLFAACQNSNNNSTNNNAAQSQTTTPAPAAEIKVEPSEVKEAIPKAAASYQKMTALAQEINDVAKMKLSEAQRNELEETRHELDDIMTKQETMMKGLDAANASSETGKESSTLNNSAPTPSILKDYVQSVNNYDGLIQDMKAKIEAIRDHK